MSADVWINPKPCSQCGRAPEDEQVELNITYNLSGMLREAGFIGWRQIIDLPANLVGTHILGVLNGMEENPAKWRAMNPVNGWGTYDECLQGRMRKWAEACVKASPESIVGGAL